MIALFTILHVRPDYANNIVKRVVLQQDKELARWFYHAVPIFNTKHPVYEAKDLLLEKGYIQQTLGSNQSEKRNMFAFLLYTTPEGERWWRNVMMLELQEKDLNFNGTPEELYKMAFLVIS